MKILASNLYYLRKKNALKQDGMQAACGISAATWSNYENGKTEPDIDTLVKISRFFKVSLDEIVLADLEEKGKVTGESEILEKGKVNGKPNGKLKSILDTYNSLEPKLKNVDPAVQKLLSEICFTIEEIRLRGGF